MNDASMISAAQPAPERVAQMLRDITISSQLDTRPVAAEDVADEVAAMRRLSDALQSGEAAAVFRACCRAAIDLSGADTCGISLHEPDADEGDVFRWIAVEGTMAARLGGSAPRDFSPCGVCVDGAMPVLMHRPERLYSYLVSEQCMHEVLLVPLTDREEPLEATIWLISHDDSRPFTSRDARAMQRIAAFVVEGLRLAAAGRAARAEAERAVLEMRELEHRVKNAVAMSGALLRRELRHLDQPEVQQAVSAATRQLDALTALQTLDGDSDACALIERVVGSLLSDHPTCAATSTSRRPSCRRRRYVSSA